MIFEENPEISDEDLEAIAGGTSVEDMIAGCIIGGIVESAAGIGVIGFTTSIAAAA